ncbi:MAG: transposase [Chloroflexi bacterium]|nr:transposase [Chloroflexota bacterium]
MAREFNGSEFRARASGQTVSFLGAKQRFIHAGRPQTNGCVERVQGTILEECRKPAFARHLIPKQSGLRRDLDRYLDYYNTDRAHTGRSTRRRTSEAAPSGWRWVSHPLCLFGIFALARW